MNRRGFTLIEMLVATIIAAVLTGGVLFVVAGLSRDHAALSKNTATPPPDAIMNLLRWDVANAEVMVASPRGDALVLIGHGGIDRATLSSTGRLSRVAYTVERAGGTSRLIREQYYLDDRARPEAWREVVARNVDKLYAVPAVMQIPAPLRAELAELAGRGAVRVPPRLRVIVQRGRLTSDKELWVQ